MFVIHNPGFGGGHNEILQQRAGLESAGWQLLFVTCDEPSSGAERVARAGIETVQIPLHRLRATVRPGPNAALMARLVPEVQGLRALIRGHGVDLVQVHGETNVHGALAVRGTGAAVCWHLYDTASPPALRRVLSPVVAGLAGSVTVTGQRTLDAYPGLERRLGDRAVVTFPAADLAAFAADPGRRRRAREELGLSDGQLVIGTVGNRNPRKGHDLLIETAAELSRTDPEMRFLILGGRSPAHAAYDAALHHRVERLGLGRVVNFVDPGSRVPELLPALDIFVLPSRPGEGMPTVILEAMACGLPVVAADVAAVREEIVPESTGLLVPPGDAASLARALGVLAGDEARRREMGREGRDRVNRRFTVERAVADRLRAWELALRAAARTGGG